MTAGGHLQVLIHDLGAEFVEELLEDFRADAPARMDELTAALRAGDVPGAARAAHTLGTMALTLGFDELGHTCRRAEAALRDARGISMDALAARAEELLREAVPAAGSADAGR